MFLILVVAENKPSGKHLISFNLNLLKTGRIETSFKIISTFRFSIHHFDRIHHFESNDVVLLEREKHIESYRKMFRCIKYFFCRHNHVTFVCLFF